MFFFPAALADVQQVFGSIHLEFLKSAVQLFDLIAGINAEILQSQTALLAVTFIVIFGLAVFDGTDGVGQTFHGLDDIHVHEDRSHHDQQDRRDHIGAGEYDKEAFTHFRLLSHPSR